MNLEFQGRWTSRSREVNLDIQGGELGHPGGGRGH